MDLKYELCNFLSIVLVGTLSSVMADAEDAGKQIYEGACNACHGESQRATSRRES